MVDEKSWKGRIVGTDQVWVRGDGSSEKSPINKVDYVSRVLKGELIQSVFGLRDIAEHFVRGLVLLSEAERVPQVRDPRAAEAIVLLANGVEMLEKLDARHGNPKVGLARDRIVRRLVDLSPRPKVPTRIGLYDIKEAQDLRPGVRLMDAVLPGSGDRRLLVYEVQPEDIDYVMREFRALNALRVTGVVAEAADPFPWSDDFIVLPITPPKGKSLSVLPVSFDKDGLFRELRTAVAAFEALATIHLNGVLHRAIDADSVFVDRTGDSIRVTFTDFHAARLGSSSIAVRLDEETELEPYAAPEIASGFGFATEQSDVFSLGLVFLSRFSGLPVHELRTGDRVVVKGLEVWEQLKEGLGADLAAFFTLATSLGPLAPAGSAESARPSAKECVDMSKDMVSAVKAERRGDDAIALLDSRYRVLRKLGEGANAATYLVEDQDFGGVFAVKRLKRASAVLEQARAEFESLRHVQSKFLPRVYDVYPPHFDVHLKMEYVPGPTLADLAETYPWELEKWLALARGLFQALSVLEGRGLLHRDIKPANIVLREDDGSPVLVDLGFSTVVEVSRPAAGTPRYLPPEAIASKTPPPTSDRYAVGTVLYQVLIGELPENKAGATGMTSKTTILSRQERVREVLLRLTDNDPNRRYQSTADALTALESALVIPDEAGQPSALAELVNPWVEQLRRIYRNSSIGNDENRGLDTDFARQTYVPTALDTSLLPAILSHRPRAVFLSGNPGDGKTAFLEMLEADLRRRVGATVHRDESGWEFRDGGHTFRSCFDASEAHGELGADAQLDLKLDELAGERDSNPPITVVVAINDGRLADFLGRFGKKYPWLGRAASRAMSGWVPRDPVWLVDLKRRSLMARLPDKESVMSRLLDVLTDAERWKICEGCASNEVCPMLRNARDLSGISSRRARERFEHLLLLGHLRLVRHITIRDLRSTLSLLIAADTSCEEIHAERRGDAPPKAIRRWFWQSLFSGSHEDPLEQAVAALDPGATSAPHIERFLNLRRWADQAPERRAMFLDGHDLEPEVFASTDEWIAAFKRRLYFLGKWDAPTDHSADEAIGSGSLLPYRHSDDFVEALMDDQARKRDLPLLIRGITQSEGVVPASAEDMLSIRVGSSDQQHLVVVKQFPLGRFRLLVTRTPDSLIETMPVSLRLELVGTSVGASITLDLYELLLRMADGLRPDAEEFKPLLADLAAFKSALLLHESERLVLIESGARTHRVAVREGVLVRNP